MKKWPARAACLLLALFLVPWAAASSDSPDTLARAEKLTSLHLLRGTGTNPDGTPIYSLDQAPTRLQGLIMMIRFLGAEERALAGSGESPFQDVSGEGAQYVAYAYRTGITNGTSPTTFHPSVPLTVQQYAAFLLRALGYSESAGDFTWGGQLRLCASLGILTQDSAAVMETISLNRGDMVDMGYAALTCLLKGESRTLAEKLRQEGVFTQAEGVEAGVLGSGAGWTLDYTSYDSFTLAYAKRVVSTSGGTLTAHVLTVNARHPQVAVRASLTDNTLGHTASFPQIAEGSGAAAVVNGNFFEASAAFKVPEGNLMAGGEWYYGEPGLSCLGIRSDGTLEIGRPSIMAVLTSGTDRWTADAVNTDAQEDWNSVLYTPAYGDRVTISNRGWTLIAKTGVIREFYSVTEGASIAIPQEGYVVYMSQGCVSAADFPIPQIGSRISRTYALSQPDPEGFTLDGVTEVISGGPRLVRDGKIVTDTEPGFTEERFTTRSTPRTAVGINRSGYLVLVCVPGGADMRQMRELMAFLDCVDAFNLDGGASCAMYYQGTYLAAPLRELPVTLQIFVEE